MNRIERERRTVEAMIRMYCRGMEHNRDLCPSCRELLEYAAGRLESCRFGENKTACQRCPVHCYKPKMRERIREVMRWSGPRMILHHPVMALGHLLRK